MKVFVRAALAGLLSMAVAVAAAAQGASPKAVIKSAGRNFGRTPSGTELRHRVMIRNAGTAPLRIGGVRLSGKGLSARLPQEIAPGGTGEIRVRIDTTGLAGKWQWKVAFRTNDRSRKTINYPLLAYLFLPVEVDPHRLFFSLYDDETAAKSVAILNHKKRPLAIHRIEPRGDHFIAALATVEPGRKFRLEVTVPKSVAPGRYPETVLLHTDDPEYPVVQVAVNVLVKRDIHVFPENIEFGIVKAELVRKRPDVLPLLTRTLMVKKRRGNFAITSIEAPVPFLHIERSPEGESGRFRIDVGLVPKGLKPGRISGNIRIMTNDPRFPELNVPVRGEIR